MTLERWDVTLERWDVTSGCRGSRGTPWARGNRAHIQGSPGIREQPPTARVPGPQRRARGGFFQRIHPARRGGPLPFCSLLGDCGRSTRKSRGSRGSPRAPAAPARGSSRPRGADARGTAGRGRSGKLSTIPCGQNKAASVEAGIYKFPFPQQRGVTSGAVAHRHGQAGPRCSGTENSLENGGLEQSWLDPPREHGQEPSQEPSRHLQRRWRRRRRGRDVPGTRQALRGSREPRGPTAPSASATEGAE